MDRITQTQSAANLPLVLQGSEYPELVKSISGEGLTQVGNLFDVANNLLAQDGVRSSVNGLPAVVTQAYADIVTEDGAYRAKIARFSPTKRTREPNHDLMIAFDVSSDEKVDSLNPFALKFKQFGGDYCLVVDNGMDPVVNDAKYISLVSAILKSIGDKIASAPTKSEELRARWTARKQRASQFFGKILRGAGGKFKPTLGFMAAGSLLYAHVPFGNEDANIGPIPMPVFVEALVDINNMPDHDATGFSEPVGATRLIIGEAPVSPTMIAGYDTVGVPSTYFNNKLDSRAEEYNESKPGLYELTIPQALEKDKESSQQEVLNEATGCYEVRANTSGGRTTVFTQTPNFTEQITVQALDGDTIAVCPTEGKLLANMVEGQIYFYQKP